MQPDSGYRGADVYAGEICFRVCGLKDHREGQGFRNKERSRLEAGSVGGSEGYMEEES